MRKTTLAAAALAALALPLVPAFAGSAPASANHTLCDNEPSDTWFSRLGVGLDYDGFVIGPDQIDLSDPGVLYVCVDQSLVVVRLNRPGGVAVCTYYTPNSNPHDDVCPIVT